MVFVSRFHQIVFCLNEIVAYQSHTESHFFVPKISTSALIKMLAQGMLSAPTLLVGFPVVVRTVSKEMVSNVQVGSVFVVHSTHYKLHWYAKNQLPWN